MINNDKMELNNYKNDTFPLVLMPLKEARNTAAQAIRRHIASCQLIVRKSTSPEDIIRTSLLKKGFYLQRIKD